VRTGSQLAGDAAERLVAERLRTAGWTILGLNVHVGRAELDIVAIDPAPPARLVVVEVRKRRSREFGLPEETVDAAIRAGFVSEDGILWIDGVPHAQFVLMT